MMEAASQKITISARPSSITLDLAKTAVLVVDMQNDFGSEGGMFQRAGIDISAIRAAVLPTARVLEAARSAGIRIIYLTMGIREHLSDLGAEDSPNRIRHLRMAVGEPVPTPDGEGRILIRGTWNTRIVDELTPQMGDIVVAKHRFSGFYQTDLDVILRTLGVNQLIVTGCTTSVCVESTIRDAMFRDYSCVLLEDCTAEPIGAGLPRSNHEASILAIEALFGWVSSSSELVRVLMERDRSADPATNSIPAG
jgi:ureidoacrylate peracid hydrolase